jgi:hypothetical protein
MRGLVKSWFVGGVCLCLWAGCNHHTKPHSQENQKGDKSLSGVTAPVPGLAVFEKDTHDFGVIRQGEEVSVRFYFTNQGQQSLIFEKVDTGCGCTLANFPRQPVLKGEKKYVEVMFNSQGRKGFQYQEVKVKWANIDKTILLTIVAQVREK